MGRATQGPSSEIPKRPRRREAGVLPAPPSDSLPWSVRLLPLDEQMLERLFETVADACKRTVAVEEAYCLNDEHQPELAWCAELAGVKPQLLASGTDKETVIGEAEYFLAAEGGGQLVVHTEIPTRPYRSFVRGSFRLDKDPPVFSVELESTVPPRVRVELEDERKRVPVGYLDAHGQGPIVRHLRAGKSFELHPRIVRDAYSRPSALAFDLWAEDELA